MTLDDIVDDLLLVVPGAPRGLVREQARRSVWHVCRDTRLFQADVYEAAIEKDVESLSIDAPADTEIQRIETVKLVVSGRDDPYWLRAAYEDGELELIDVPTNAGTITVRASLRPADASNAVPAVFDEFRDAIGDYATYRLLKMPGQKWTNPAAAGDHLGMYRSEVARMNVRRAQRMTAEPLRTTPHYLA